MKPFALALLCALAGTAPALADWTRSGTLTGPRGQMGTVQGGVTCAGGTCERDVVRAGPRGVSTRSGSITREGPGAFSREGVATGPRGRVITREGTLNRR